MRPPEQRGCILSSQNSPAYNTPGGIFLNPCELPASITAIANALACRLTTDQLNLLGAILTQLADTLLTIAAHRSICCPPQNNTNQV